MNIFSKGKLSLYVVLVFCPFLVQADFEKGEAANRNGDRNTAYQEYYKAANGKDARAYGKLASMYLYGLGTNKNYVSAYAWFGIAELSGDKYSGQFKKAAASSMSRDEIKEADNMLKKLKQQLGYNKSLNKK